MRVLDGKVHQELFQAAEQGNLSEIEKLLSLGSDVLANHDHHTVLHSAVVSDNENVVKLFLNKIKETQGSVTPYIDAKDTEGDTPLMWTAESGHINAAKVLLSYGADVEAKNDKGMTALHWAAKENHIELLKLLIGRGASINVKDKNGKKPSDNALDEGHLEVAGLLICTFPELLRKQGKYDEALEAYREAVSFQEIRRGADHLDTLMTCLDMAQVLFYQGYHSEALQIYQEIYDILKRKEGLGPDHPYTLKTLFNIAVIFGSQGNSSEVSRIFQEILDIKGVKICSSDMNELKTHIKLLNNQGNSNDFSWIFREMLPISPKKKQTHTTFTLVNNNIEVISRKKINIGESSFSEKDEKSKMNIGISKDGKPEKDMYNLNSEMKNTLESEFCSEYSSLKSLKEVQPLHDKYLPPKFNELEGIKNDIREHLKSRFNDVFIVRGKDRGYKAWHYVLVDSNKKEIFLEASKSGSLDVSDYGTILHSGWGENPPEKIKEKIDDFFKKKVRNILVIKEISNGKSIYHYAVIDPEKRKNIPEEFNEGFVSVKKIENCGSILYSGWGPEPYENVTDYIIKNTYFATIGTKLIEMFTNLFVMDSSNLHDAVKIDNKEALEGLVKKGVDGADKNGWTLLHHAAYTGNVNAVHYLIENGANLHIKDVVCGRNPLHIAAREGYKDVIELLMNRGSRAHEVDRNNWTLLHYATWSGNLAVVRLLIDKGFDIHAREDTYGKMPIHIAAERGYLDIVKLFLRSGSGVDDADRDDRTSFYYAARKGHLKVVKYLADEGANIHAEKTEGVKPIHVASSNGHIHVIIFLLDRKANVNDCNKSNETPLHYAACQGQLEAVKFLLGKGANIHARTKNGKTPSDLAGEGGHTIVKNMLDGPN